MTALGDIREFSLHETLRMMAALWNGIAPLEADREVPQWLKDLLARRGDLIHDGKATFIAREIFGMRLATVFRLRIVRCMNSHELEIPSAPNPCA